MTGLRAVLCVTCLLAAYTVVALSEDALITCGKLPIGINSTNIKVKDVPWVVKISGIFENSEKFGYFCMGSLISHDVVITTAHCVKRHRPTNISVPFCETSSCERGVAKIIIHPAYSTFDIHQEYDIALIKLDQKIQDFQDFACLPHNIMIPHSISRESTFVISPYLHKNGTMIIHPSPLENKLELAPMPVTDNTICEKLLRRKVPDTVFCAGGLGLEPCTGSSGSPLFTVQDEKESPQAFLLGMVNSGSVLCGNSSLPTMYNNIGSHVAWIKVALLDF